jgi:hypothetical protein
MLEPSLYGLTGDAVLGADIGPFDVAVPFIETLARFADFL